MKFSSKIEGERHEPWAAHYLNYSLLKKKQHDIEEVQDKPGHEHVYEARKHIFQVGPLAIRDRPSINHSCDTFAVLARSILGMEQCL